MSGFGGKHSHHVPPPTVRLGEAEPSPIWTGKACKRLCSWQSVPRQFPAHSHPGRLNSIGSRKGQYSGNSDLVWHLVPLWDVTRCPSFLLVSTCGTRVLPTVPRLCLRVMMLKTAAQLPLLTALWAFGARHFLLSSFFFLLTVQAAFPWPRWPGGSYCARLLWPSCSAASGHELCHPLAIRRNVSRTLICALAWDIQQGRVHDREKASSPTGIKL